MDPAIERLSTCSTDDAGVTECEGDSVAFKRLMAEYGVAFAPTAMHSARTTGFGGLRIALEGSYTGIDEDAEYWRRGTRGEKGSDGVTPIENTSPDGVLQLYSLKLTKGFGMGVELTGAFGMMPHTELMNAGIDLRLGLLEGFRDGFLGHLPDFAVGAGVRTVTGAPALHLTIAGLDARFSKPLVFGDTWSLSPWIGYQFLWILADPRVVDFTPGTDALDECHYSGDNAPDNPDPAKNPDPGGPTVLDGQPSCAEVDGEAGSIHDYNQYGVLDDARLERHRLMVGARAQYEFVALGAQVTADIVDPADAQNTEEDKQALKGTPSQWTLSIEAGVAF